MVLRQGLRHFFAVVEVAVLSPPDLIVFVAFAGHQDRLAGAGQGHGQADSLPAVRDHQVTRFASLSRGGIEARQARVRKARLDLPDDGQGVFGAGIVAGDDDQVRTCGRGCPMSGLLPRSRSPPQPNTVISREKLRV